MLNQKLSSPTEPLQNTHKLSNPFQKREISNYLCHIKHTYMEDFNSHKRNLKIQKKRLAAINSLKAQEDTFGQGLSIVEFISECLRQTYTLDQMNKLITCLYSTNLYKQHFGAIGIRKVLSVDDNPPIQLFINAGIIPKLVEFLGKEDDLQLQLEAAWSLSNMASGAPEQTKAVVDNGAIPGLIKLLGSPKIRIKAQAAFALGNIACDNIDYRNTIIQEGAVGPMIQTIKEASSGKDLKLIKEGTWALSILCRKKPLPPYEATKESLPILTKMIMSHKNVEILSDALWALASLSDQEYGKIQEVFDTGVVPSIIRLVEHPYASVSVPSLRIIGNICSGHAEYVDMLLDIDVKVVGKLFEALSREKMEIRRDAALALSHIAKGNKRQKELIVGNAGYLDQLFEIGLSDVLEVRREVSRILNNVMTDPIPDQLNIELEKKILKYFGELIEDDQDIFVLEIGLEGIQKILELQGDQALEEFSKNRVIFVIGELRNHANRRISQLATEIIDYDKNSG